MLLALLLCVVGFVVVCVCVCDVCYVLLFVCWCMCVTCCCLLCVVCLYCTVWGFMNYTALCNFLVCVLP